MEESSDEASIVLDLGAHTIKMGLAGEDEPQLRLPSLAGHIAGMPVAFAMGRHPRCGAASVLQRLDDHLIQKIWTEFVPADQWNLYGARAEEYAMRMQESYATLPFVSPIYNKAIRDLDAVQQVCAGGILELELPTAVPSSPESRRMLFSEGLNGPKRTREELTSMAFEELETQRFYLNAAAVLSLYSSGRTSGTVVDVGYDHTSVVAVYEGYALPHTVKQTEVAGHAMTQFMAKQLGFDANDL